MFLTGYRALELSFSKSGYLCGKILSDLGIEVIMVEPPGGDRYRITEQSYWAAYNGGKSSITLATDTKDGKYLLYELIRKVDFFIVSYDYVDSKKPDIEYEDNQLG